MGRRSAARREVPGRPPAPRRHRSARPAADTPSAAGIAPRPTRRALGLQRHTTPKRAGWGPVTSMMTCRIAAAVTCLRRRNALLPGIICRRLQITAVGCVGLVVCRVVWTAPDRGNLRAAISVADALVMGGRMRSLGDPAAHEVTLRCDQAGSLANGGTCSGTGRRICSGPIVASACF
jgi:hypothetical protein